MAGPRRQPGDALTALQRDALERHDRLKSIRAVAAEMGLSFSATQQHIASARFKLSVPEGIRDAAAATGLDLATLSHGWIKAKGEDGAPDVSGFFKTPRAPEDFAERIRAVFEDMTPAPVVAPPKRCDADLLTLYPLFDVHLGMLSWGRETGEDYDLTVASTQLRASMAGLIVDSPEAAAAVLLVGGDWYHGNDQTNATPRSRHVLDVDGRHFKVLETGIVLLGDLIDAALHKHAHVIVRVLPGNHDPVSCISLVLAIAQRYRLNPRVTVDRDPGEVWAMAWGRCLIAGNHGHRVKFDRMALWLAEHRLWRYGQSRHCFFGHEHHEAVKDVGGVRCERLRPFAPRDAHSAGGGFAGHRGLQAITFCKVRGRRGTVIDEMLRPLDEAA